jgi:hypothetical protein
VVVLDGREPMPVVEPRPAEGVLARVESEGFDQMKRAAGGDAGPAYVASVVRDFGLDEHDVEQWVHRTGLFQRNFS